MSAEALYSLVVAHGSGNRFRAISLKNNGATTVEADTPVLPSSPRLAWSPDGQYVAAAYGAEPYLTVIRTSDWSVVSGTPTLTHPGVRSAFSPDSQQLAVTISSTPNLSIINTADWSVVSGTPFAPQFAGGVVYSPNGQYLALVHGGSSGTRFRVYRTADWSVVSGTPTLAGAARGIAWSPDGAYIATAHSNSPYLTVIRASDWSVVSGTPTLAGTGFDVAFDSTGEYLAAAHAGSPQLTVIHTSDWSVVSTGIPGTGISDGRVVAWSPDGAYIAQGGSFGYRIIDVNNSWSVLSGTPGASGGSEGLAFYPLQSSLSSRVIDVTQPTASPRTVLFGWQRPQTFLETTPDSTGHWIALLAHPAMRQHGLYYLSQDTRNPPIIQGPYTATED